ncbi:hypothetical protein Droror1_Dr00013826 [Drosera rotundifolia]
MGNQRFSPLLRLILCLIAPGILLCVQGSSHREHTKLFAFGDSYADTGNTARPLSKFASSPWTSPYGISFPGNPDGRYSDGLVFTDYLAKYMGMRTPVAYKNWRDNSPKKLRNGMNFAYGGTGVFDTLAPYPNMTTQIDLFEQLVKQQVYPSKDLRNSVVLVQLSGNDYATYLIEHPDLNGVVAFIGKVVAQLVVNIRRIYSMGVKQVLVSGLQPLGCLPLETRSTNYTVCNSLINVAVGVHNGLLKQAVTQLNSEVEESYTPFILLDMHDTFMTVINNHTGDANFGNPLEPCCIGINSTYSCASYTDEGAKLYTLCESRKSRFLWDSFHPTNEGWNVVSSLLHDSLSQLQLSHKHK